MATTNSECMRIRTGYERVMAHRVSKLYAYPAEQDGKVIEDDKVARLIKIQYKDGSLHTIPYGEEYGSCSDMITTQKAELTVGLGDTFKRGEILCYNPQFFEKDPYSKQVDWKHGTMANVAIMKSAILMKTVMLFPNNLDSN